LKTGLIDLKEGEIILYSVEKRDGEYRPVDTQSAPLKMNSVKEALSGLLKTPVDYIYLSLPLDMLSLRELEFPFADRNKIAETIKFEIDGLLLGDPEDYIIDHLIIHASEASCKVMAVCIEKKRIKEILETFSSAGLDPAVITSIDVALLNMKGYKGTIPVTDGLSSYDKGKRLEIALREVKKPTINLRKEEFQYRGDIENIRKTLRLTVLLCILLLLIFTMRNLTNLLTIKGENRVLSKRIYEIYHNAFPDDKKIIDPLRQFKGKFNQMMRKKKIFGRTSPLDNLRNITESLAMSNPAKGETRSIRLDEFRNDSDGILIKGTAHTFEDVEALRNRLSFFYDDVRVLDSALSIDKKVNFTIMMKEREI